MIGTLQSVAQRQAGVFSRRQATAYGYSLKQIRLRVGRGLWCEVHAGVYAAGSTPVGPLGCAWAAYLAAGPDSAISHLTAARLWELPVEDDGLVHLSVDPARRPRLGPPVRVHRVQVDDTEVTRLDGLPLTVRAVTVLDCLSMLGRDAASRLFDRALQQGWLRQADVERRLRERSGRPGNRQLRRLAARLGTGAQSAAERILHRLLRQAGITGWQAQFLVRLAGRAFRLDVAFPALRLAIEVDGRVWHSDIERFQADRTRQNALVAAGWTVLRFTWTDLVDQPDIVVQTIRQVLAELAA